MEPMHQESKDKQEVTTIKPDKIIMSNQLQSLLLLLSGGVLILLTLAAIAINMDDFQSSGVMGFVPVVLMGMIFVFILLPRFFSLIGSVSEGVGMIEISNQVRVTGLLGGNERYYPLEDVAKMNLYKQHFELTLSNGREFSFSTADYSVAQLKAFFSHIGLHCTHESDCTLIMGRPAPMEN